jgi:hypothetical protein
VTTRNDSAPPPPPIFLQFVKQPVIELLEKLDSSDFHFDHLFSFDVARQPARVLDTRDFLVVPEHHLGLYGNCTNWHHLTGKGMDWHEERIAQVAHRPAIPMVPRREIKAVST